jgi:hypothetical protein
MNPQEIVKKMVLEGNTQEKIARVMGWNQSTVSRYLKTFNFSVDETPNGDWSFNCPNCNCDFVHISPATNREGYETSSNPEETQGYRGGGFTFNLWCERCDKNMDINFNEHKGNTFITVTNLKENEQR